MKYQTLLAFVVVLSCLLLVPQGGETAGGIVSLHHPLEESRTGEQLLDKSPDEPQTDQLLDSGLADTLKTVRVRRAPEEGKKKKKDKKNKNKDPKATKKPKAEKKSKKKGKTTTTVPPTTTAIPTEPPTQPEPYTDYPYPDLDTDYWKPDDDYWGADTTPSRPQTEAPITEAPITEAPVTEAPITEAPITDIFWRPDDYWKPDEPEPEQTATDGYDDYWKPDETDPYGPVTDSYDDWKEPHPPTSPAPQVDGNTGTDDSDYWDAIEIPDNLPDPDGKEVSPEIKVETLTEEPTTIAPHEGTWYDDYEDYGKKETDRETDSKWMEKERKRAEKEREREEKERSKKLKEAEERARNRPRIYKEPKICPPLGMESHRIEPDQLSASSVSQYRFSPQRARLNMQASDDEDSMRGGAWCANSDDRTHWFEIDARRETEFTGVITQGKASNNESDFVISYFIAFSNDSREWTTIHDGYDDWLFFANNDKDTPVMNRLAEPVLARYIRIIPQSWNGSLCMRLEVLGCPVLDPAEVQYRQNEVTPVDYLKFKHHSYSDMVVLMKSVHDECPNITSIYSLGRSSNGLDIIAMIISGNPKEHEVGEPEVRFTAGLHGNEAVGRELLLLLMQFLCKEYKDRNPRVQRLVEGIRLHLVPSLNPDGQEKAFETGSELSGWTTGHFTEDGFDIFENFPDLNTILWDAEDKGLVPKLMPNHHIPVPEHIEANSSIAVETRAIISWMRSYPFVLGANFQGGESIVAYPYDNMRMNKPAESQRAHSRKKRQYEEEDRFDVTEWGRGYQEEPEEEWRGRGYAEPEEEWRGHRYDHGYDRGYEHERERGYEHEHGYEHERGYEHGYDPNQGYGHREEEDEERRRGDGGGGYAEPDDEPRATADESLFRWLAVSYASTHLTMTHNYHGACHGDTAAGVYGIVNRAKWKPITGSMNDFSYLHTNCFELSIFLGCDKFPHESELTREWEKNREAMLIFLEQVHRGIRGIVKDEQGNPIGNATISVEGVNHDVTTAPSGDYWRLLNPGEYRVTARAEGFSPKTQLCVVGYQPGATACSFNLAKSHWDRIKQIMALHGNKPIRLVGNARTSMVQGNKVHGNRINGNRRVIVNSGSRLSPEQQRRIRIARIRRLRRQRLLRLRATTTTLPPTTTTTIPTIPESTTSWYDSWMIEGQSSTPGGFTDSILDFNYEYKIDDY